MKIKRQIAESLAAGIIAEIKNDEALLACKNLSELGTFCVGKAFRCREKIPEVKSPRRVQKIVNAALSEVNLWLVAEAIEYQPHWDSVDMNVESHSAAFRIKHRREANYDKEEALCDELWQDEIYLKIRSLVKERTGK